MKIKRCMAGLIVAALLVLAMALPGAAQPGPGDSVPVWPSNVTAELAPGETMCVNKTVTVPTLLPKADVVISVDLTGSMIEELTNLKTEIASIVEALSNETADLNVGIVSHEDYPEYYDYCGYAAHYGDATNEPFRVDQAVSGDFAAAKAAVQAMSAGGGADLPESYARVMWESGHSDNLMGYRADAQKILIMFLDDRPHDCGLDTGRDPGRDADVGTGDDIDLEDDAIPAMQAAGVTLLVVSSGTHTALWNGIAGVTGGSAVQINADGTVPGGISLTELILDLVAEVETDVWWQVAADPGLSVVLTPAVHYDVPGGSTVQFQETITVAEDATPCTTLDAVVTFYANSYPEEGAVIGRQYVSIKVEEECPPLVVWCVESVNPHGQKVPPAGKTTMPGPKGGQNEDGFYQLLASGGCGEPEDIEIYVDYAGGSFGPFVNGTVIKFTEAPGAPPSQKKIGSANGQAGAVSWHITLPSDPVIRAVDVAGNVATCDCCLVPPPPK